MLGSVWDEQPHPYGNAHGSIGKCHTFQRGSGKGPERDGASLPAFLDSEEEGASKHQSLQRWDSKQLFCDQDSSRLQDIHLDTFIF